MNAMDALSTMLQEGQGGRQGREKQEPKFSIDQFLQQRPELAGMFMSPVDLPVAVAEDVFACHWDIEERRLSINESVPPGGARTAVEICSASQFGALARDDRGEIEAEQKLCYRVSSQYASNSYAHRCLSEGEFRAVLESVAMQDDAELLRDWPSLSPNERLCKIATGLARWGADPARPEAILSPVAGILEPVPSLLPAGDPPARPLVPAAYANIEALRQRLIRAQIDGNINSVIVSAQKSMRKRIKRLWEGEEGGEEMPAGLTPYFGGKKASAAALFALNAAPEEVRGQRLVDLLGLESAIHDVHRQTVGFAAR
eukprot:Hpha_TRINITY_DN2363_c0_g1::TRINITY_DN2363_c0_g1_i1::g.328::m.328